MTGATHEAPAVSRPEPPPVSAMPGLRVFARIWAGRLVSQVGSGLTAFALGVWVYRQTGSVTQYAVLSLATVLPAVLALPFAGVLVDRWDRRRALMVSEAVPMLMTATLVLLVLSGRFHLGWIAAALAVSSAVASLQGPALGAAVKSLVPPEHFARAAGLTQLSSAVQAVAAPALAGALVGSIGLAGILALDVATFVVALLTLSFVRIPRPAPVAVARAGFWSEAAFGWRFIAERPGLLGLLVFFAALNAILALANVLATPLVLSFASPTALGTTLALGASGMIVGSLLVSVWGGPRRRVAGMLGFALLLGVALIVMSLRPSTAQVSAGIFVAALGVPVLIGCSQAIWQGKTPAAAQGRVFGVRLMITQSCAPAAYVLAGPLADRFFEPWLAEGGLLAGSLGRIVGVGVGRGVAALYLVLGVLALAAGVLGWAWPRLRRVEDELPDVE